MGARLDLIDRPSIDAAVGATVQRFERLDVLVNNGIYQGPMTRQTMLEVDIANAERATMGNFINQFYLTRDQSGLGNAFSALANWIFAFLSCPWSFGGFTFGSD